MDLAVKKSQYICIPNNYGTKKKLCPEVFLNAWSRSKKFSFQTLQQIYPSGGTVDSVELTTIRKCKNR